MSDKYVVNVDVWERVSSDYLAQRKISSMCVGSHTTVGEIMEWVRTRQGSSAGDPVICPLDDATGEAGDE